MKIDIKVSKTLTVLSKKVDDGTTLPKVQDEEEESEMEGPRAINSFQITGPLGQMASLSSIIRPH